VKAVSDKVTMLNYKLHPVCGNMQALIQGLQWCILWQSIYIHILQRILLVSSPGNDSFWEDLSFSPDVFKNLFSTRVLRDAWADRREILHGGQY